MEITLLSPRSIKIKGKQSSLVVDPQFLDKVKIAADAVLVLSREGKVDLFKIENSRLLIQAAGEYEIGGVKVSVTQVANDLIYSIRVDGINIILTNGKNLDKVGDKGESQILILFAETPVDESVVTALSPRIVVLYGEEASKNAGALGSDKTQTTPKLQTTLEKLPQELEVVVLK